MSKEPSQQEVRIAFILELYDVIDKKRHAIDFIRSHEKEIESVSGQDIIIAVDRLVKLDIPMPALKQNINKLLNVLGLRVKSMPIPEAEEGSLMHALLHNYQILNTQLKEMRPLIKQLNDFTEDETLRADILRRTKRIHEFISFYEIKENVLFPLMEKHYPDFHCVTVMWSFHDDIGRNLKLSIELLENKVFDLKRFNRSIADVYFNIHAIWLRDIHILFPEMMRCIPQMQTTELLNECIEMGFPYFNPKSKTNNETKSPLQMDGKINLETGSLSAEQIMHLFKHLPVDITYVDANDKVCFFSDPPHRIFPRSKAVIGRDVHKCHPPESVHIVEQIVESFREGRKNEASFWITMRGRRILIQYFALRNKQGEYQGVIEVSQDITEIQKLEGEQRLLSWED